MLARNATGGYLLYDEIEEGEIPAPTTETGVFATILFIRPVQGSVQPTLFSLEGASSNRPSMHMRSDASASGNARIVMRDPTTGNVHDTTIGAGNAPNGTMLRASAAWLRREDGLSYRPYFWVNGVEVTAGGAANVDPVEHLFRRLLIGAGTGSTLNEVSVADFAIGWGETMTLDRMREVHAALHNGGALRSIKELPIFSLFAHAYDLGRTAADVVVLDDDAEIQDMIGGWHLRNATASALKWDNTALPFPANARPSVIADEEVDLAVVTVGVPSIIFPGADIYDFENADLDFTLTIDDPTKIGLSAEAIANSGLSNEGGGVYTRTGKWPALRAMLRALPFLPLAATLQVRLTITVFDGVSTATLLWDLRVTEPDIVQQVNPGSTVAMPRGFAGSTVTRRFYLRNLGGGGEDLTLGELSVTGDAYEIVSDPSFAVLPPGRPNSLAEEVFVDVRLTRGLDNTGQLIIPSSDPNSPAVIDLASENFDSSPIEVCNSVTIENAQRGG